MTILKELQLSIQLFRATSIPLKLRGVKCQVRMVGYRREARIILCIKQVVFSKIPPNAVFIVVMLTIHEK